MPVTTPSEFVIVMNDVKPLVYGAVESQVSLPADALTAGAPVATAPPATAAPDGHGFAQVSQPAGQVT